MIYPPRCSQTSRSRLVGWLQYLKQRVRTEQTDPPPARCGRLKTGQCTCIAHLRVSESRPSKRRGSRPIRVQEFNIEICESAPPLVAPAKTFSHHWTGRASQACALSRGCFSARPRSRSTRPVPRSPAPRCTEVGSETGIRISTKRRDRDRKLSQ